MDRVSHSVRRHYDLLAEEGNDPVTDPPCLRDYMDKWDGQTFFDALALTGKEDVLEIGVGTGRLAVRILPLCHSFCGMDLSEKSLDRARVHLSAVGTAFSLICADFCSWETEKTFDVICSSLTFMHIQDKERALRKTAYLLRPGGRLVLSTDKNPAEELDYGSRKLQLYPDTPERIRAGIREAGLLLTAEQETEFAVIYTAVKQNG